MMQHDLINIYSEHEEVTFIVNITSYELIDAVITELDCC